MGEATKRRWFRFSLRTLLVVVTMIGCWLGYELYWIHQRHEAISIGRVTNDDQDPFTGSEVMVPAPGLLWLFGERGHSHIYLQVTNSW